MLTVPFNQINWLQVPQYNLYSSTAFYTNVLISTFFRGCGQACTNALIRNVYYTEPGMVSPQTDSKRIIYHKLRFLGGQFLVVIRFAHFFTKIST